MLIETAVDKARGNLSAAARMLGLTRPQLAYRLKRLHEADAGARQASTLCVRALTRVMARRCRPRSADYLAAHHVDDAGHPGRRRPLGGGGLLCQRRRRA